jgi:hypothetical protein
VSFFVVYIAVGFWIFVGADEAFTMRILQTLPFVIANRYMCGIWPYGCEETGWQFVRMGRLEVASLFLRGEPIQPPVISLESRKR